MQNHNGSGCFSRALGIKEAALSHVLRVGSLIPGKGTSHGLDLLLKNPLSQLRGRQARDASDLNIKMHIV
jgi:hypothetical protein